MYRRGRVHLSHQLGTVPCGCTALQWLRDNMLPYYPLGVYKDVGEEAKE